MAELLKMIHETLDSRARTCLPSDDVGSSTDEFEDSLSEPIATYSQDDVPKVPGTQGWWTLLDSIRQTNQIAAYNMLELEKEKLPETSDLCWRLARA